MAWFVLRHRQVSVVAADPFLHSRRDVHSAQFLQLAFGRNLWLVRTHVAAAFAAMRPSMHCGLPDAGPQADRRPSHRLAGISAGHFPRTDLLQPHQPAIQRGGVAGLCGHSSGSALDAVGRVASGRVLHRRRRAGDLFSSVCGRHGGGTGAGGNCFSSLETFSENPAGRDKDANAATLDSRRANYYRNLRRLGFAGVGSFGAEHILQHRFEGNIHMAILATGGATDQRHGAARADRAVLVRVHGGGG